jgi:opacity protein-like surface antigen
MTTNALMGFSRVAQLTLAAAGLAVAAGAASAADLPTKAPMVKAPYNWSGCYVGGFFGYGVANDWHTTDNGNFAGNGTNSWLFSLNSSPTGGGYVGCNWQPSPGGGLVLGIDGEGGYLQLSAPGNQPLPAPGGLSTIFDNTKIGSGYGAIGGRIGWVFLEKIHVYGKVGVASTTTVRRSPTWPFR